VLDTNVLMHDPMSLFRFEEHDVFLPMITLEELDGHKKGMSEVARNARQVSRDLDALATDGGARPEGRHPAGQDRPPRGHRQAVLPDHAAGHQAAGRPAAGQGRQPDPGRGAEPARAAAGREVVLVSKDINMRVKARALGLPAEDYFNDKTLEDGDLLYTGVLPLPADFWERHGKTMESWQQGGHTYYRISGPLVPALLINQFVYLETPGARRCTPA
jgi:PhoH-like ATPase